MASVPPEQPPKKRAADAVDEPEVIGTEAETESDGETETTKE